MFGDGCGLTNSTTEPVSEAVVQASVVASFQACLDAELQGLRERLVARVESLSRGMATPIDPDDEITISAKSTDELLKEAPDPCAAIRSLRATAPLAKSGQADIVAAPTEEEIILELDEIIEADESDEHQGLALAEHATEELSEPLENWAYLVFMMGFGVDSGYIPKARPNGSQLECRTTWMSIAGWALVGKSANPTTSQLFQHDSSNQLRSGDALRDDQCRWLRFFIMNPHRWRRTSWGVLTVLVILWDATTIPLQLFDLGTFGEVVDMVASFTLVFWIVDIVVNFFTGLDKRGVLDMRTSTIARHYMSTWFFPDLSLVLLDVLLLTALDDTNMAKLSTMSKSSRLPRVIRLIRLVRLMRVHKAFIAFDILLDSLHSSAVLVSLKLLQLLLITMLINHYVACCWYALAFYNETGPRWTDNALVADSSASSFYLASLHWSLTQFSPATQNIGPVNEAERAFAIVIVIAALGLLTSLAGSITKYTTDMRQMNAAQVTLELRLRQFFMSRRLSTDLAARIQNYAKHSDSKHRRLQHEADLPLLKALPEGLRVRMHNELYMPVLTSSPLFSLLSDNMALLNSICHTSFQEKSVPPRSDIFVDNAQTDHAYFSVAGRMWYGQDRRLCDYMTEAIDNSNNSRAQGTKRRMRLSVSQRVNFISPETWLSEMALWSEWSHRGFLQSETQADLIAMNAQSLFSACSKHKGPTLAILQKIAIFSVSHVIKLEDEGDTINDLSFDEKVWQQIYYRASRLGNSTVKILAASH